MNYRSADEWREAAMQRPDGVDAEECERRREMARQHGSNTGVVADEDTQADYELFIRGKMNIEEYQAYLLFKHGHTDAGE